MAKKKFNIDASEELKATPKKENTTEELLGINKPSKKEEGQTPKQKAKTPVKANDSMTDEQKEIAKLKAELKKVKAKLEPKTAKVNLLLRQSQADELRRLAKKKKLSLNAYITNILESYLDKAEEVE